MTKPLTKTHRTRRAFGHAFAELGHNLPSLVVTHWRDILMPWRRLPYPVALGLIGLVALAMVCAPPEEGAAPVTELVPEPTAVQSMIGGQVVPDGLNCFDDEVIGYVGVPDTLVCVPVDNLGLADAHGCIAPAVFNTSRWECVIPPTSEPSIVQPGAVVINAACDDNAPPGYTWAGNATDGYQCVPLGDLDQYGGRTGHIVMPGGRVDYHTEPCLPGEQTLPSPFADVPLCVNAADFAAIQ